MPILTSVNAIREVKPGATVLLNGTDERRRDQVVLVSQRYGRGKTLAFPVQDSWHWQMDVKMTLEDQTHENYWRQLLRWLVDGVPNTVDVHTTTDRVEPGEPVTLVADVVDPALRRGQRCARGREGHRTEGQRSTRCRCSGPASATANTARRSPPPNRGCMSPRSKRRARGKSLGTGTTEVRAVPSDAEYFDATMHAARLKRIAEETGGRFYTPETIAGLPEDLRYTGRGVTTVEERELWHMPIVLFVLLGLISARMGLSARGGDGVARRRASASWASGRAER